MKITHLTRFFLSGIRRDVSFYLSFGQTPKTARANAVSNARGCMNMLRDTSRPGLFRPTA